MLNSSEKEALKDYYKSLVKAKETSLSLYSDYTYGSKTAYDHALNNLKACFPLEVIEFEKELETELTK